jgi:excisionase family DNA binding protein
MGEYITIDRAAELLHVSPTTVRRWIYQGRLKTKKFPTGPNAKVLIDKDDIEAFLVPIRVQALPSPYGSRQAAVEAILALQRRFAGRGIDVDSLLDAHRQEQERA